MPKSLLSSVGGPTPLSLVIAALVLAAGLSGCTQSETVALPDAPAQAADDDDPSY